MYLLDTNVCVRILNKTSDKVVDRLRGTHPGYVFLSSVVKAELVYGAYKSSRSAENLRLLKRFFGPFVSIPFDDRCHEHYGRIRCDLERAGEPIGPNDVMIAASALAHSLTLVTHNQREFRRVAGLELEDWE